MVEWEKEALASARAQTSTKNKFYFWLILGKKVQDTSAVSCLMPGWPMPGSTLYGLLFMPSSSDT